MSVQCNTPKELGEAIKNKEESIYIEGDFKNKVVHIQATGAAVWGACAVSLGIAIAACKAAPALVAAAGPLGGGTAALAGVAGFSTASAILGSAAVPAVLLGVAGGGIGALNSLRNKYKIVEKNDKYIKLQRK